MFYLKDFPTEHTLSQIADRYSELDPSALKTCVALLKSGSDLLTAFETLLGRHGLSQGRFLSLIVLNRHPEKAISPSTIAEKVGVKPATMTGLLDGLEQKGQIKRLSDPEDRRRVGIQLTEAGRQILDKMLPGYYKQIAKFMADLDEDERQNLIFLLGKVNKGLSALAQE